MARRRPPAWAHVHGLAVDPADGSLLAGTHFGAFKVGADGNLEQFGPVQDHMGFSVAGPGHHARAASTQRSRPVSHDEGKTWVERGNAGGQAGALTAAEEEIFVATREGAVVESSDGGETFPTRYRQA